ncbi:MAG: thiamine pyrophosphate-dependent enzyme [Phycisphaerae bacterium]|nr:thiamine pyrophosphate-dependent enzyme [Phycisphaerae bacterium]
MTETRCSILTARRNDMCFCAGCSHGLVLERLAAAIDRLGIPHERVCIVSDIGCIGMADRYFACHTFHGLHGRSVTYAEGIRRACPGLLVIVLIGDGGCGIGTTHLVHAARRDADIKVIVCNNFNFGMTGGQHSPTTPWCACTDTTPGGASEQPFDVCRTVIVNGASHVARLSAHDPAAAEHLAAALRAPGFALVDLWELCTAYYVAQNKLTPAALTDLSVRLAMPFGLLFSRTPAESDRATHTATDVQQVVQPAGPHITERLNWPRRVEICVAGSAGQRIRSAVGTIGEIAVAAGLFAAQQDDFPVTVRKGHSLSNLIIAPAPIRTPGVDRPDLLIVLSADGLQRIGDLSHLPPTCTLVADASLEIPPTPARVSRFDRTAWERRAGRNSAALTALVFGLLEAGLIERTAFRTVAEQAAFGRFRDENLGAIRAVLDDFEEKRDVRNTSPVFAEDPS